MGIDERVEACIASLGAFAQRDVPLGAKTTYRVGGSAAVLVEVTTNAVLERLVGALETVDVDVLVLGNGSNLLIADSGFAGLVVHLGGDYAECRLDLATGEVDAGGAVAYPVLARQCAAGGLVGLEWAVGIPGTVGGAVAMNAGGHGSETAMHLSEATVLDLRTGAVEGRPVAALECGYRQTNITPSDVVIRARFHTDGLGEVSASQARLEEIVRWRRAHQPGGRNCGSVFANPVGDSAGRLIEAAGLKGFRLNHAAVSTKHANFIQTDEGASANDVRELIDIVRARVLESFGVELHTELRLVGFGDQ